MLSHPLIFLLNLNQSKIDSFSSSVFFIIIILVWIMLKMYLQTFIAQILWWRMLNKPLPSVARNHKNHQKMENMESVLNTLLDFICASHPLILFFSFLFSGLNIQNTMHFCSTVFWLSLYLRGLFSCLHLEKKMMLATYNTWTLVQSHPYVLARHFI